MLRVKSELRLWSREQALELIREAAAVVDEAELPDDLRPEAFAKACQLLGERQVELEQVQVGVPAMAVPQLGR